MSMYNLLLVIYILNFKTVSIIFLEPTDTQRKRQKVPTNQSEDKIPNAAIKSM